MGIPEKAIMLSVGTYGILAILATIIIAVVEVRSPGCVGGDRWFPASKKIRFCAVLFGGMAAIYMFWRAFAIFTQDKLTPFGLFGMCVSALAAFVIVYAILWLPYRILKNVDRTFYCYGVGLGLLLSVPALIVTILPKEFSINNDAAASLREIFYHDPPAGVVGIIALFLLGCCIVVGPYKLWTFLIPPVRKIDSST